MADNLGVGILELNFARALIASFVLGIAAALRYRRDRTNQELKGVKFSIPLILGAVGMVMISFGLNMAFLRISIGLTMVLYYSSPFLVMAGSWFIGGEKPTFLQITAFAIALGAIWFAAGGARKAGTFELIGAASAFLAAAGSAMYILNGRYGAGRINSFGSYVLTYFFSTFIVIAAAAIWGDLGALRYFSLKAWLVLAYIAIMASVVPYYLLSLSLRWVSGNSSSVAMMCEVPFSMMWAWIILSEIPEPHAVIGGMAVLVAVSLLFVAKR